MNIYFNITCILLIVFLLSFYRKELFTNMSGANTTSVSTTPSGSGNNTSSVSTPTTKRKTFEWVTDPSSKKPELLENGKIVTQITTSVPILTELEIVKKLESIISVKKYINDKSTIKNLGDILTILIIFKYHEFISQQDIDSINERIYLYNNIKFKSKKKENLPNEIKIAIMQNLKYIDKKVYKLSLIKKIFNKYDLITKINELLNPDTDDLDICDPGPDGLNASEIINYSTIEQEKEIDLFYLASGAFKGKSSSYSIDNDSEDEVSIQTSQQI